MTVGEHATQAATPTVKMLASPWQLMAIRMPLPRSGKYMNVTDDFCSWQIIRHIQLSVNNNDIKLQMTHVCMLIGGSPPVLRL